MITPCRSLHLPHVLFLLLFLLLGLHIILIQLVHGILATRGRRSGHILEICPIDQAIGILRLVGQFFPGTFQRSGGRRVLVDNVKLIHNEHLVVVKILVLHILAM
jgi:hypothetical protein